ncbi:MAG TPA: PEP-CTERM sorting domain-containing protein [Rubrivivax sp.]|nr:PEP-CTERM sorting domain-containing protein [Rubrivivax sp.]
MLAFRPTLLTMSCLTLCAALAAPAQAAVATAAFNRVPSGDPFLSYHTYRMSQDAAGRFTIPLDNASTSFFSCPSPSGNPQINCGAVNTGTQANGNNNLSAAASSSDYSFAVNGVTNKGQASAAADLAAGTLRTVAISNGIVSQAHASLSDRLTFHVAGATDNTLTQIGISFTLDGRLDAQGRPGPAMVGTSLAFGSASQYPTPSVSLFYQDTGQVPIYSNNHVLGWDDYEFSGIAPGHIVFTGHVSLHGTSEVWDLVQHLNVETWDVGIADFGHTSHLSLILPSNVTFTSDSGVFLSAAGGTSVPEPESLALVTAALLGLRWRRRK